MRADRLLAMMLVLQARGRMTAQELAANLEVSERTIYRDIEALSAAGAPIYTQSGANGGVFLDEHYRISLTGLSRAQVLSLFISSDAGPLEDLGLANAVEETLLKLFAALPSMHRHEVERLRQRFYIDPANWFQMVEAPPFLDTLQQALWEDRRLRVSYQTVDHGEIERTIEPYGLVAKANIWYLAAKHPGDEMHTYRVSRFQQMSLMDTCFHREPNFDLIAYWKKSCAAFEEKMRETFPPYPATVHVHPDALWYFPSFMSDRYEQIGLPDAAGWVTLQVSYESMGDAQMRVLGLGASIAVLEPVELRDRVLETARAIVAFHTEGRAS
ncbi:MAG: YafY family transcriptional regulator [Chloroflexales bacterium]|nr:YafY family transcriptional regulator [Chloroflexales bacterium]